jgi:hypothetical protein
MTIDCYSVIGELDAWAIGNGEKSHNSKAGLLDFRRIKGNFT